MEAFNCGDFLLPRVNNVFFSGPSIIDDHLLFNIIPQPGRSAGLRTKKCGNPVMQQVAHWKEFSWEPRRTIVGKSKSIIKSKTNNQLSHPFLMHGRSLEVGFSQSVRKVLKNWASLSRRWFSPPRTCVVVTSSQELCQHSPLSNALYVFHFR